MRGICRAQRPGRVTTTTTCMHQGNINSSLVPPPQRRRVCHGCTHLLRSAGTECGASRGSFRIHNAPSSLHAADAVRTITKRRAGRTDSRGPSHLGVAQGQRAETRRTPLLPVPTATRSALGCRGRGSYIPIYPCTSRAKPRCRGDPSPHPLGPLRAYLRLHCGAPSERSRRMHCC